MHPSQNIDAKLKALKPLLQKQFGVSRIGYFGSYASNSQTGGSDLDLLVEFSEPVGWDFFALEQFLEQSLGLRVDLVTKNALKRQIKESVLRKVKYV